MEWREIFGAHCCSAHVYLTWYHLIESFWWVVPTPRAQPNFKKSSTKESPSQKQQPNTTTAASNQHETKDVTPSQHTHLHGHPTTRTIRIATPPKAKDPRRKASYSMRSRTGVSTSRQGSKELSVGDGKGGFQFYFCNKGFE